MIKAFAALAPKQALQPFEYDPGPIGDEEVEIDIAYCGICHSDLSMIDNEWRISKYPLIPGHEVVGTISQVGHRVSDFKTGQIVGLGWHSAFCNHCHECHSGDHNLCHQAQGTIVGRHGGFADKVRAEANSVVALPEGIDLKSAGPLFCGGITVFNPLIQFDIKPTDKVAVIGIGGLGHIALQFLNAWGCEVTAFTSSEHKQQEAFSLGAHHTLNSTDKNELEQATGRFDLILSTVNVKLDWNRYINTLKTRGRLHFVGATMAPLDLNASLLMSAQRSVSGSPVGSPDTIRQMLTFAKRHKIEPVVEVFPMDQVNEAIEHLKQGKAHYRVVLEKVR